MGETALNDLSRPSPLNHLHHARARHWACWCAIPDLLLVVHASTLPTTTGDDRRDDGGALLAAGWPLAGHRACYDGQHPPFPFSPLRALDQAGVAMSRPVASIPSPLPQACPASPGCRPPAELLAALGLPRQTGWRWLHLGPIAAEVTPVAIHDPRHCCENGGGGAQPCDICRPVWTRPEHKHHVGYRLDLFCLTVRPPSPRRALPFRPLPGGPPLWPVAAFASSSAAPDLWAACLAGPDGRPVADFHVSGRLWPTSSDLDALNRCADLMLGAAARVGRRRRSLHPRWRQIVEAAEALKLRYPGLEWEHIAAREMVPERTLRRWRADHRRDRHAAAGPPGPTIITGGLD